MGMLNTDNGNASRMIAINLHDQYMAALVPPSQGVAGAAPVTGAGMNMMAGVKRNGSDAADVSSIDIQPFVKASAKRKVTPKAPANKKAKTPSQQQQQQQQHQHQQQMMMMMNNRAMHGQPQAAMGAKGPYGIAPAAKSAVGKNNTMMQHLMNFSGAPEVPEAAQQQQPPSKKRKTAPKTPSAAKPPTKAQQAAMLRMQQQQQQQQQIMMQDPKFANAAAAEAYKKALQQRQQSGAGPSLVPNGSMSTEVMTNAQPDIDPRYADGSRAFTLLGCYLPPAAGTSTSSGKSAGNNDTRHKLVAAAQGRSLPDDTALRYRMTEIAKASGMSDGVSPDCVALMQASVRHFAKTLLSRSVAKARLQTSAHMSTQLLRQQELLRYGVAELNGVNVMEGGPSLPPIATPSAGTKPTAKGAAGKQSQGVGSNGGAMGGPAAQRKLVKARDLSFVINMGGGRSGGIRSGAAGSGSGGGSGVSSGRILGAEHEMHVNRITLLEPDN